jgi:hypothetical protein
MRCCSQGGSALMGVDTLLAQSLHMHTSATKQPLRSHLVLMYTVADRSARTELATPARRRPHLSGSVCMSSSMPAVGNREHGPTRSVPMVV